MMASTKLETQLDGDRPVVVKSALDDRGREQLAREADRLGRARHPGVIELLDAEPGRLVLAWAGQETFALVHPEVHEAAALLAAVAATLADLHELGIVHGRLTPDHVVVGGDGRPRIGGLRGPAPDEPRATPAGDVADVGHLIDRLLGPGIEGEPIPERRWARRRSGGTERRALLAVADRASQEDPAQRPTARSLALMITDAVPGARLARSSSWSLVAPAAALPTAPPPAAPRPVRAAPAWAVDHQLPAAPSEPGPPSTTTPPPLDPPPLDPPPAAAWPDDIPTPPSPAPDPLAAPPAPSAPDPVPAPPAAPAAAAWPDDIPTPPSPAPDPVAAPPAPSAPDPVPAPPPPPAPPAPSAPDPVPTPPAAPAPEAEVSPPSPTTFLGLRIAPPLAPGCDRARGDDRDRVRPRPAGPAPRQRAGPGRPVRRLVAATLLGAGALVGALVLSGRLPFAPRPPVAADAAAPTVTATTAEPATTASGDASQVLLPCVAVAPPSADVDGDGCAERFRIAGTTIDVDGVRWSVGTAGDHLSLGDWDCDGRATPGLVRPRTGEVFLFARWPDEAGSLTATPVITRANATALVPSTGGSACAPPSLRLADGRTVAIPIPGDR